MTFVLVGGGPTGVELAGALGEIARDTLRRDFRSIDPRARGSCSSRRWTGSCRPTRRIDRRRPDASSSAWEPSVRTGHRVVDLDEQVRPSVEVATADRGS